MKNLITAALALLLCGCVSSKEKIERGEARSTEAATAIKAQATAGGAELDAALAMPLPEAAVPPVTSARQRFGTIDKRAGDVLDSNASIREGLQGVINRPRPLWKRLLWGLLGFALLAFAFLFLFPQLLPSLLAKLGVGIPRHLASAASFVKRTRKALDEGDLERARREVEAHGSNLRGTQRGEAAWQRAKE
jgi:hypothetical protein